MVRERLTFRRTLSTLCWTLILGLEPLDMPSMANLVYRYLLMKHLDPETALYTLSTMETEEAEYLLLLCKKNVYKGIGGKPEIHSMVRVCHPKNGTARKIERMYCAYHSGQGAMPFMVTADVPIRRQETVVSWIESMTEEQNNRHWGVSREEGEEAQNMAYDYEEEEEDTDIRDVEMGQVRAQP